MPDERLKQILTEAHKRGASREQLDIIVQKYEAKNGKVTSKKDPVKKKSTASPSASGNGNSSAVSGAPTQPFQVRNDFSPNPVQPKTFEFDPKATEPRKVPVLKASPEEKRLLEKERMSRPSAGTPVDNSMESVNTESKIAKEIQLNEDQRKVGSQLNLDSLNPLTPEQIKIKEADWHDHLGNTDPYFIQRKKNAYDFKSGLIDIDSPDFENGLLDYMGDNRVPYTPENMERIKAQTIQEIAQRPTIAEARIQQQQAGLSDFELFQGKRNELGNDPEWSATIRNLKENGLTDDQLNMVGDVRDFAQWLSNKGYDRKLQNSHWKTGQRMFDDDEERIGLISEYISYKQNGAIHDINIRKARLKIQEEKLKGLSDQANNATDQATYNQIAEQYNAELKKAEQIQGEIQNVWEEAQSVSRKFQNDFVDKFPELAKKQEKKRKQAEDYWKAKDLWKENIIAGFLTNGVAGVFGNKNNLMLGDTVVGNTWNQTKTIPYELVAGGLQAIAGAIDVADSKNTNPESLSYDRNKTAREMSALAEYMLDWQSKTFDLDVYTQGQFMMPTEIYEDGLGNRYKLRADGFMYDENNNIVQGDTSSLKKVGVDNSYDALAIPAMGVHQAALIYLSAGMPTAMGGAPMAFFASSYKQYNDTYMNAFPDAEPWESFLYASAMASAEAASWTYAGNSLFGKEANSAIINSLAEVSAASRRKALKSGLGTFYQTLGKGMLPVTLPRVVNVPANMIANAYHHEKKLEEGFKAEDFVNGAITVLFSMGPMATIQGVRTAQSEMRISPYNNTIFQLAQNPELTQQVLKQIESKEMKNTFGESKVNKIKNDINEVVVNLRLLPKQTTQAQYEAVKPLLDEKADLRQQQTTADDAFKGHFQTLIDGINLDITEKYNNAEKNKQTVILKDGTIKGARVFTWKELNEDYFIKEVKFNGNLYQVNVDGDILDGNGKLIEDADLVNSIKEQGEVTKIHVSETKKKANQQPKPTAVPESDLSEEIRNEKRDIEEKYQTKFNYNKETGEFERTEVNSRNEAEILRDLGELNKKVADESKTKDESEEVKQGDEITERSTPKSETTQESEVKQETESNQKGDIQSRINSEKQKLDEITKEKGKDSAEAKKQKRKVAQLEKALERETPTTVELVNGRPVAKGRGKDNPAEVRKVHLEALEDGLYDDVPETDIDLRGVQSEEHADSETASILKEKGENPIQIAREITRLQQKTKDAKDDADGSRLERIWEALRGGVSLKSFHLHGDRNQLSPSMKRTYNISAKNDSNNLTHIDLIAQRLNMEVQDLVDFMIDFPNREAFENAIKTNESPEISDLKGRFEEITGLYPSRQTIEAFAKNEKSTEKAQKTEVNLPENNKKVEENFRKDLTENYDKKKKEYKSRFGNVINTDNARTLSEDYNENPAEMVGVVHAPASEFAKKLFDDAVNETPESGYAIFTAGGTGAGKSTAIEGAKLKEEINNADFVFDSNLDNVEDSKKKIDKTLQSGREVTIIYTYRNPKEAFDNGVLPRMHETGRPLPIDYHLNKHDNSLKAINELQEHYKENPNVEITVIDNSLGKDNQQVSDLETINKKHKFADNETRKQLHDEAEQRYKRGEISKSQFEVLKRPNDQQGTQSSDRGSSGTSTSRSKQSRQDNLTSKQEDSTQVWYHNDTGAEISNAEYEHLSDSEKSNYSDLAFQSDPNAKSSTEAQKAEARNVIKHFGKKFKGLFATAKNAFADKMANLGVDSDIQFIKGEDGTILGLYDAKENKIYLNEETLNPETVFHELSHFQQNVLEAMAKNGNKEAQKILKQFDKLLKPFIRELEAGKKTAQIGSTKIPLQADVYRRGENESHDDYRQRMRNELWAFVQAPENVKLWAKNDTMFKRAVNQFLDAIRKFFADNLGGTKLGDKLNIPKGKDILDMTLGELVQHTAGQLQSGKLPNIGKSEKGSVQYSASQLKQGAKNIIADLVKTIKGKQGTTAEKRTFGKITKEGAEYLSRLLGVEVSIETRFTIDRFGVNHTINEHGNKSEEKRGQIPITDSDFESIAEILSNPKNITSIGKIARDGNGIQIKGTLNGEDYFVVQAHRTGKNELAFTTMWKTKERGDTMVKPSIKTSKTLPLPAKIPNLIDFNVPDVVKSLDDGQQPLFQKGNQNFKPIAAKPFRKLIDRLTRAFPALKDKIVLGEQKAEARLKQLAKMGYDVQMQSTKGIKALESELQNKYPELKTLHLSESDGVISIDMIEVEKTDRKKGIGSEVIQEIVKYADLNGKTLELIPALKDKSSGTTSRGRLVEFYKRFGFVENKGRNKDFARRSGGMYRNPIEFMRTNNGDVYGFLDPVNGKIYLTNMNANTPIHEIAGHSFLNSLKATNKKVYNEIISKLQAEKALMDEVRNDPNYAHLKTDEQVADELFARMTGNEGERMFNEMQDRNLAQKIKDTIQKLWEQLKKWTQTGSEFKNIKEWSLEDFQKATLNDVINNLTKDALRGKEVLPNVQKRIAAQKKEIGVQMSLLSESDFNSDGTVKESVMAEIRAEMDQIKTQAKANGTFMKAPNGKKSKLNDKQWVQVRTSRFKKWFGDWESLEKSNNFDKNNSDNDQRTAIYNQLESVLGRSGTQETQIGKPKTYGKGTQRTSGVSAQALRQALVNNAKKTGNYIDDVSAISGDQMPSGHESEVYESKDGKTVLKVNRLPFLNDNFSFNDWVEKIIALNQTFPDVAYTIKGVTKNSNGEVSVVLEQPRVSVDTNKTATQSEIDKKLTELGFTQKKDGSSTYWTNGIYNVSDAEPKNVLKDKDGDLYFVDGYVVRTPVNEAEVSKVVDENGEPMVVYHGTNAEFNEFMSGSMAFGSNSNYFTTKQSVAKRYGDVVMPVFLNIKEFDAEYDAQGKTFNKWTDENGGVMIGYSGLASSNFVIRDIKDGRHGSEGNVATSDVYAVGDYNNNQIKSATDNVGTFSDDTGDIRFQILGEKGAEALDKYDEATHRMDNLSIARQMEESGKTEKEIRFATGWEKGVDGLWRYEINDYPQAVSDVYELQGKRKGVVNEKASLFGSKELNKAYPELENVQVKITISDDAKNNGSYENLFINGKKDSSQITINATDVSKAQSILLHEIQHAIQEIEGFARGGNEKTGIKIGANNLTDAEYKLNQFVYNNQDKTLSEMEKMPEYKKLDNDVKLAKLEAEDGNINYLRLAGEVESRNVQSRMNMTPEQRRETLLSETQYVAREDQIVMMDGVEQAMSLGQSNIRFSISNSNTNFTENEETKRYKDSQGNEIPYNVYSPSNNRTKPNLLQREKNQGSGENNDFALVERQFIEDKNLDFTAGTKIESLNDVAWLFRNLEDEAVEHAFVTYIMPDGSYVVQHLSVGGIASTVVDGRLVVGNAVKMGAKSIAFVHNHPSGILQASGADMQVYSNLKKGLEDTGIELYDGVIINLRSGKFVTFDGNSSAVNNITEQNQAQHKVQILSFSKQSFAENYNPDKISSPSDVAQLLSTKKFGVSDKTEMLVLNNSNEVIGKFVLPETNQYPKIVELLTQYGGVGAILYGNEIDPGIIKDYNKKLKAVGFSILDAVEVKSDNYRSLVVNGLVLEDGAKYKSAAGKNRVIPLKVAREMNEAMLDIAQYTNKSANIFESGMDYLKTSEWYEKLTPEQQEEVDSPVFRNLIGDMVKTIRDTEKKFEETKNKVKEKLDNQKSAAKDLTDFINSNNLPKKHITETELKRLMKRAGEVVDEKSLNRFENTYQKIILNAADRQARKVKVPVREQVDNMLNAGMSEQSIVDSFSSQKEKDIATDQINRSKPTSRQESINKWEKAKKDYKGKVKPKVPNAKKIKRGFAKLFTDRQFTIKSLLAGSGMGRTERLIVNAQGAKGYAKQLYDEAYDKIWGAKINRKPLNRKQRENLNDIIFLRRIAEIERNREDRGLPPIMHTAGMTGSDAVINLENLKNKIGEKEFNKLNKRADIYFDTFKKMLRDKYEAGLLSKEAYDSIAELDYSPRKLLGVLLDFNGDATEAREIHGKLLQNNGVKSLEEGSMDDFVKDSEWLLLNAMSSAYKNIARNKVANMLFKEIEAGEKRFEATDPKSKMSSKDREFYDSYKELTDKVFVNPIIGNKKDGSPKYKFGEIPNFTKTYRWVNGQRIEYFVEDSLYHELIGDVRPYVDGIARKIIPWASGSAIIKYVATGNNPAFFIANTPRDAVFNFINSKRYSAIPVLGQLQSAKEMSTAMIDITKNNLNLGDNLLEKLFEYGLSMEFLSTQGRLNKTAFDLMPPNVRDVLKKSFGRITMQKLQTANELMFRVAIAQRVVADFMRKNGIKDVNQITDSLAVSKGYEDAQDMLNDMYERATYEARSILDFSRGGRLVKDLELLIPYSNVAVQSLDKVVEMWKKRPVETFSKTIQVLAASSAAPVAISLMLIGMFKDDDDEDKSAVDIYMDSIDGLSLYEQTNYTHIPIGKKDENGNLLSIRIAKEHALTPLLAISDFMVRNYLRKRYDRPEEGLEVLKDRLSFAFRNNLTTVGDATDLMPPTMRAVATYSSGYDFFREQYLQGTDAQSKYITIPRKAEGIKSPYVEDFWKVLGEEHDWSPVRTKAAFESVFTSPSTSPLVGMAYGGADVIWSQDKTMSEISNGLKKNMSKAFTGRLIKNSSDFNRGYAERMRMQKLEDDVRFEVEKRDIKENDLIRKRIKGEISVEDFRKQANDLRPGGANKLEKKYNERKRNKGLSEIILNIKHAETIDERAAKVWYYYGDIYDPQNREALTELRKAGGIVTYDFKKVFKSKAATE